MNVDEKKESMSTFGERVRYLGTILGVDESIIRATFIKSLPPRIQSYAYSNHGTYNQLVASIDAAANIFKYPESIRRIADEPD